jgi:hypothetical protein
MERRRWYMASLSAVTVMSSEELLPIWALTLVAGSFGDGIPTESSSHAKRLQPRVNSRLRHDEEQNQLFASSYCGIASSGFDHAHDLLVSSAIHTRETLMQGHERDSCHTTLHCKSLHKKRASLTAADAFISIWEKGCKHQSKSCR